jgi:hypothetical protein
MATTGYVNKIFLSRIPGISESNRIQTIRPCQVPSRGLEIS